MKIDRMAGDGGIIRESNTALLNHNKSVDKINEIIDVINAQEDKYKDKKGELVCCSRMAQAVKGGIFKPIYYDTDSTKTEYYSFSFRVDSALSVSAVIHYCPFCGAPIKCPIGIEERTTLNQQEQEQILESLSELCANHKKYDCKRLDRYPGICRDTTPEIYIRLCDGTRKAIIRILNRFELPLLNSTPYSSLKENIEYIISKGGRND